MVDPLHEVMAWHFPQEECRVAWRLVATLKSGLPGDKIAATKGNYSASASMRPAGRVTTMLS
jgi:hypothetical protein